MSTLIAQQSAPDQTDDAQAEAIAQRLAEFEKMMTLIESFPNRRAEAGLGPLPDNIREIAYDEREDALL